MFELDNLKPSNSRDADLLVGYLAEYEDPGIRLRPRDAVDQALNSGLALVLRRDKKICGCSLIYQFQNGDKSCAYSEIGTMRITQNGFDLQTLLAHFHLVQIGLENDFDAQCTVFAVVEEQTASEHNLVNKVGMKRWKPPEELVFLRQSSGVAFSSKKYSIVAENSTTKNSFTALASQVIGEGELMTLKGNEKIRINMPWFRNEYLNIDPSID